MKSKGIKRVPGAQGASSPGGPRSSRGESIGGVPFCPGERFESTRGASVSSRGSRLSKRSKRMPQRSQGGQLFGTSLIFFRSQSSKKERKVEKNNLCIKWVF